MTSEIDQNEHSLKVRKVLISYFFGHDMIPLGKSCVRSFEELGWEVACFNSQVESKVDLWVLKYLNRLLRALGLRSIEVGRNSRFGRINHKRAMLRKMVARFRPDWILVIRSHEYVDRAFAQALKRTYGVKKVIGWRVDGPMDCPDLLEDATVYDHYFCIHRHGYDPQRDGIHHLPAFGVDRHAYWPPPEMPARRYRHDIVFVGGTNPRRRAIIARLLDLPIELYGGWLRRRDRFNWALRRHVKGRGIWGKDLVELYHASKIVLNISAWDPKEYSGLNLRIFDVPATGAFLMTDYSPELEEYYTVDRDVVCFRDIGELRTKLVYYLAHPEARECIARSGHLKSLTLPTVTDRVKTLIDIVSDEAAGCARRSSG